VTASPRRVYLNFVGCRLNEAEIERMARQFAARGDSIAGSASEADLVVINTCAVTSGAERKSRQMVLQAGRMNPEARIVVTGCYAQLEPEALARLPHVDQVISNFDKDNLVPLVAGDPVPEYEQEPLVREAWGGRILPPGTLRHTRAFVKAQDGCDNHCAFCVTRLVRGAGRSRPLEILVDEINLLLGSGYQEIVLTGVHLGSYGRDLGDPHGLFHLVRAILERTAVPRLRLSSLEPWDLTPAFFDLWRDPRLCPHLHLPLQAGCDATLRRMVRRTTRDSFAALVEAARVRIPDLALTTDIIVGFPGETDAEFEESRRYVESIGFARLHVFPYSARPGTAAARMPGQVAEAVKRGRSAEMLALSERLWRGFQAAHVGRTFDVLWESAHGATPDGWVWSGLTETSLRVVMTSREHLANTITPARIIGVGEEAARAIPI